ncbi:DUF5825 family protein [Umezawaea sp. Da 62-37]|uniref:DUF5825 family protein n=1 Tax=Umezawaea sp. Da 62-37 TaxID=3075927 RepID=UPI0028F7274F|nr:DUF5825 family protein [Umezawaea sp. Da 62-37]WNV87738.1 DUF5825 family protein [Umezawaea sp. Da 62-37]
MNAFIDISELRARSTGGSTPERGRPAAAILTLGADGSNLPTAPDLAVLLARVPVAEVRLARPVDLSDPRGGDAARTIALVRECSSVGARVTWSLTSGERTLDVSHLLGHLPAPHDMRVVGGGKWRSTDDFGLLYFRRGPGFLSVVDRRSGQSERLVLDDRVVVDVFTRGLEGCPWSELSKDARQAIAAQELVAVGLLLRVGDHYVTLPVHMRSWPMGTVLLGGTLASAGSKDAPERL